MIWKESMNFPCAAQREQRYTAAPLADGLQKHTEMDWRSAFIVPQFTFRRAARVPSLSLVPPRAHVDTYGPRMAHT